MGRKRELDEIEAQMLEGEKQAAELRAKLSEGENRRALAKASVEAHHEEIEQLKLDQNTKTMAIASQINVEYSSLSTRTDFVTETLHRLNGELEALTTEKGEMEDAQQNSDQVLAEKADRGAGHGGEGEARRRAEVLLRPQG